MTKDALDVRAYGGMFGSADPRDLAAGIAAYAKNLDMATREGDFVPLPEDAIASGLSISGGSTLIAFEDASKFVYHNGTVVSGMTGLGGTVAVLSITDFLPSETSSGDESGVSDGVGVHVGLGPGNVPAFVGSITHGQFGGAAPGMVKCPAYLNTTGLEIGILAPAGTSAVNEDEAIFANGSSVFYFASFVYDGFQESPLQQVYSKQVLAESFGYKRIVARIRINETQISPRVTAVNVYRGTHPGTVAVTVGGGGWPESTIELIKSIDINDGAWTHNGTEDHQHFDVTDDGQMLGEFEERTGIPATRSNVEVSYGLSCASDSYHIIGKVSQASLGAKPNMLIRSKSYRYDTFDWVYDYLVLPSTPRALKAFQGRVYAFSKGRTYVIDPNSFIVLSELEGMGGIHSRAVATSDSGMLWVDETNIYWHNGSQIKTVGLPVLNNGFLSDASWNQFNPNTIPTIVYVAKLNAFLIIYKTLGGTTNGLLFDVNSERWTHVTFPVNGSIGGAIVGPGGEVYYIHNGTLYRFIGAGTNRDWEFVTHDMVDSLGAPVIFYHANVSHGGSAPSVTFYQNDPSYQDPQVWTETVDLPGDVKRGRVNKKDVNVTGDWDHAYSFAIKLTGTGTQSARHVSVMRRRLRGLR